MLDELNLPMEQKLALVIVLAIVNIFLWRNLGYFRLDIEPKQKDTRKLQNANYGAYIQAQGRYYN
ncbi:hypothetical protein [Streptococcus acidominimus]|uniref:Phage protein n=1 Tax=Streptococcus acidominimus TaxID=1326 RepID=A0A1Q8ED74_STRAI|nr:hypothetical protein [Streptococcus acidominimus]OLF49751.1 hypothetical protein BU200_05650 [Streptococcus acidominimus]QBX07890.1 hypothetical protein JavanS2_0010 [Streptococcus satellite phage Javan2]SUN06033.1 phage protein [Streptococcus acidominimus]